MIVCSFQPLINVLKQEISLASGHVASAFVILSTIYFIFSFILFLKYLLFILSLLHFYFFFFVSIKQNKNTIPPNVLFFLSYVPKRSSITSFIHLFINNFIFAALFNRFRIDHLLIELSLLSSHQRNISQENL